MNDDWFDNAACRGESTELFYQPDWECKDGGAPPLWTPAPALAICDRCPVVAECRKWATDTSQAGVWGGTTEEERRRIRRRATRSTGPGQPRAGGSYTITPEDEARRRQLWKEGHTDAEIAVRVGRTTDVIREWRDRRGLKNNKQTRTPQWVHELRTSLYQSGRTDAEIAAVTKSTVPAIKAWRRKQGLPANRPATQTDQPRQKVTA